MAPIIKSLISKIQDFHKKSALRSNSIAALLLVVTTAIAAAAILHSAEAAKTSYQSPASTSAKSEARTKSDTAGLQQTTNPAAAKPADGTAAAPAKPTTATTPTPSTKPAPAPTPAPTPQCPECTIDPDKVIKHNGTLILSATSVTLVAGDSDYSLLVARSDSGEAITIPYPLFGPGSPMISTSGPYTQATYGTNQTFGFAVSLGVAPGVYNLTIRATSQTKGAYTSNVTVTVLPAE